MKIKLAMVSLVIGFLYLFGGSVHADAPVQVTTIWQPAKQISITKFQDGGCTFYLYRSTVGGSDGAAAMVAGPGCR